MLSQTVTYLVGLVVKLGIVFVDFWQFRILEAFVQLVYLPLVPPFDEVCPHDLALWEVKLARPQEAPIVDRISHLMCMIRYV